MAKILVVDDQESILKTVEALLKKQGHEVTCAADGYIALEKVGLFSFDLIVADAMMPGISGFDLVKSFRLNDKTKNLPIVMMTSRRERRDVEKAIQAKVDDFIVKPLEPDVFVAKIAGLLAKKGVNAGGIVEVAVTEDAELKVFTRLVSISEEGMTFNSSQPFPAGAVLPATSALFAKISILPQEVRVISCQPKENTFLILTQFTKIQPKEIEKLRAWIAQQKPAAKAG